MRTLFLFFLSFFFLLSLPQFDFAGVNPTPIQSLTIAQSSHLPKSNFHPKDEGDDKLGAVIGYFGILGFLISYLAFYKKESSSEFLKFHLRQAFGNALLGVILSVAAQVIGSTLNFIPGLSWIFWLLSFWPLINLIIGIINAVKGEMKLLPLIGAFFDKTFKFLK